MTEYSLDSENRVQPEPMCVPDTTQGNSSVTADVEVIPMDLRFGQPEDLAGDHTRTTIQPVWADSFCQLMQVIGRLMFSVEPAGEVEDGEHSLSGELENTVSGKYSDEDPAYRFW